MDYWQNNNYYSNPNETTNYISSTIEYAPPIICPTKNIYTSNTTTTTTTTSTNSNIYSYKTINTNKYQTNTHYKTQNETNSNYDEFYNIPPTYNDIIFTNGNQEQTKKNTHNNTINNSENKIQGDRYDHHIGNIIITYYTEAHQKNERNAFRSLDNLFEQQRK